MIAGLGDHLVHIDHSPGIKIAADMRIEVLRFFLGRLNAKGNRLASSMLQQASERLALD